MNKHERVIEAWMQDVSSGGGVERYDDLHIDRIDAAWKPKGMWLQAALESFQLAIVVRDRLANGMSIVLALHLIDGEHPLGLNFKTVEEFEQNLGTTPPSLYLMHKGTEFWNQTNNPDVIDLRVRDFDRSVIGAEPFDVACHYMEFKRISTGEYTRSVFIHC